MTKKVKMVLLLFTATVLNVLLMIICFTTLLLLYTTFMAPNIPENISFIGIPLIFTASLVLSFLIYQKMLKQFLKKHPIN